MSKKRKSSQGFNHDTNQKRKVGMMKESSNFDRFKKINPFTQMAANPCKGKKRG